MANDFKIVSGDSPHCWSIDSKGKVSDVVHVDEPGVCAVWVDDSEEFTKAQADAVRKLIVKCRKDGTLDEIPKAGVQYPTEVSASCAQPATRYLRTWPELLGEKDQDLQSGAWVGICWDIDFDMEVADKTAPPVEPTYEWVAGEPVPVDEKPAASVEEQPQSEESLEGEEIAGAEMVPGQVCSMEGDKGAEVQAWQTIANEIVGQADLDSDLVKNDGVFGPKTVEITKVVQEYLEVPVTGSCDQVTWDTVLNLYN